MKAKKTQNNEDEKVSIWDYIEKGTLLRVILIVAFAFGVILALWLGGILEPSPQPPNDFHMHP